MKTCSIYARVSSQSQSSDRQLLDLEAVAEKEGYQIIGIYKDVLSGFKDEEERPELQRLKEDAKKGMFDTILFSEFSRLSRKVSDLTNLIDLFRSYDIELFFQKQNIWVKGQNDIGTSILIQVLGVVSQYEIELFAERSVSGKINALKNHGILMGKLPFGYKQQTGGKRMIIDQEEAKTVQRIFDLYISGYSAIQICDLLNSENVITPMMKNAIQAQEKRVNNGKEEKEYKYHDFSTMVWQKATLTKILNNEKYIGVIKTTVYKPDVTNKSKNKKREILEEISFIDESIRIITDEQFKQAKKVLKHNTVFKNPANKHNPLLNPSLIICSVCGQALNTYNDKDRSLYQCSTSNERKRKNLSCSHPFNIQQNKLDGLVLALAGNFLTYFDLKNNMYNKTIQLKEENINLENIIKTNQTDLENAKNEYNRYILTASKYNVDEQLIEAEQVIYTNKTNKIKSELEKNKKQLLENNTLLSNLEQLRSTKDVSSSLSDVATTKAAKKALINEYIESINTYHLTSKINMIKITFKEGTEIYGTIKKANHTKEETLLLENGANAFRTLYCNDFSKAIQYNTTDNTFKFDKSKIANTELLEYYPNCESGSYSATEWLFNLEHLSENNTMYYKYYNAE